MTDLAGNAIAAQTTQFTTGAAPQTYTTYIVNANPPANQSNVPVNVAPSLQCQRADGSHLVNSNSFQVYDTVLHQTVAGTYSLSADGLTAYFLPNALLATGRTYNVNFNGGGYDRPDREIQLCPVAVCTTFHSRRDSAQTRKGRRWWG